MEKFHKYCLSVLLVIICSNISAQISNGNAESENCKQLYRLYHQILSHHAEILQKVPAENAAPCFTISQKRPAGHLVGSIFKEREHKDFYKKISGTDFFPQEKHHHLLKNFEKKSREQLFARNLYFKTKVSKVRNKDYLNTAG